MLIFKKPLQQIKFVRRLNSDNGLDADDIQNKFILKILEKVQKTKLKFSQGSITLL